VKRDLSRRGLLARRASTRVSMDICSLYTAWKRTCSCSNCTLSMPGFVCSTRCVEGEWIVAELAGPRNCLQKKTHKPLALATPPRKVRLCQQEAFDRVWPARIPGALQGAPPRSSSTSSSRRRIQYSPRSIRQGARATPLRCVTLSKPSHLHRSLRTVLAELCLLRLHVLSVFSDRFFGRLLTAGTDSQLRGRTSRELEAPCMCNNGSKSLPQHPVVLRTRIHPGAAANRKPASRSHRRPQGATRRTSGSRARVGLPLRWMTHQATRVRTRRHHRNSLLRPLSILLRSGRKVRILLLFLALPRARFQPYHHGLACRPTASPQHAQHTLTSRQHE